MANCRRHWTESKAKGTTCTVAVRFSFLCLHSNSLPSRVLQHLLQPKVSWCIDVCLLRMVWLVIRISTNQTNVNKITLMCQIKDTREWEWNYFVILRVRSLSLYYGSDVGDTVRRVLLHLGTNRLWSSFSCCEFSSGLQREQTCFRSALVVCPCLACITV